MLFYNRSKLEVGQFVRFKDKRGIEYIRKIVEIPEDNRYASLYLDKEANYSYGLSPKNVINSSYNIIDLIEVGDILEINGEKYEVIYDESYEKLGILIPSRKELSIRHIALEYVFKKYEVVILTKGQFEQMAYKMGD